MFVCILIYIRNMRVLRSEQCNIWYAAVELFSTLFYNVFSSDLCIVPKMHLKYVKRAQGRMLAYDFVFEGIVQLIQPVSFAMTVFRGVHIKIINTG